MSSLRYFTVDQDFPDSVADDAGLLARVAGGDAGALDTLWSRYGRAVTGVCRATLGERFAAEHAARETFRAIGRRAGTFDPLRNVPAAWIMGTARSVAHTAAGGRAPQPLATCRPIAQGSDLRLTDALAGLAEPDRLAVELAYFADLPHSRLAAALGEPLGAVTARIREVLVKLAIWPGGTGSNDAFRERLPELLWARPAGAGDAELRSHVAACEECRLLLARIAHIEGALRDAAVDHDPSFTPSRHVHDISLADEAGRPRESRTWRWAAAVVVATVGITLVLHTSEGDQRIGLGSARTILFTSPVSAVRGRLELAAPRDGDQSLRLVASGLGEPSGWTYELWLVGPKRVSAGQFRAGPAGDCDFRGVVPVGIAWTSFRITRQRAHDAPALPVVGAAL